MAGRYTLDGPADDQTLPRLHELVDRTRADHPDLEPIDVDMLETALIEIAGNMLEHGTPRGGIDFVFCLDVEPDRLEGLLLETGDPVELSGDELDAVDELSESGRGVMIARAVLNEFRYERRGDLNAWVLSRWRSENDWSSKNGWRPGAG